MKTCNRTPDQLRTAAAAWLTVARRKAGYLLEDERAAAVRAWRYLRRCAWQLERSKA